jgi:hypothetical protein
MKSSRPGFPVSTPVSPSTTWKKEGVMHKRVLIAALLTATALSSCAKEVPPEKASYVGEWQAQTMALLITQDGSVMYKRIKGGMTTSVNGPLRRFEGNNFVVGVPLICTTFQVSSPPYQEGGNVEDGRRRPGVNKINRRQLHQVGVKRKQGRLWNHILIE